LGKQLREYVTGIVTSPGDSFARALNKALSGDREAMSSLPGLAASATDQARNTSSTREQFAAAQARILSGVLEAAAEAQRRGIETPEQAAQTLQQKLLAAQSKLAEALATANAIGAPLVAQQERLIEQYRKALDELVDARAAADRAQATLDAISGNTASTARSLEQWADWVDTEFGKIDTTLDGLLTFDELKVAVAGKATDQQIVSMMNLLDTNNDGLVSKLEAQIGASTSLPEQISLALGGKFDALTKNTAGLLNFDQFKSQFVGLATDTKLLDIFKELDVNGDGQIAKLEAIRIASQTQAQKSNVVAFDRNDPLYSIWSSINTSTAWLKEIHGYLGHIHNTQLGDVTRQNAHQNLLQSISNRIWSTLSVASQNRSGTAAYFATGGAFTNSVVSRPTAFSMGVMGEAGPEAIMPLSNVGGSLGVRANMPGVEGMLDELRALREEVAMLRAEARATAINTGRTQDIMKRITKNGESMIVSTDGEALEVTTP
jgi:Ca2+-binding EF-hand superfamily protein